ncbi:MAG: BTAD domain-containing putative transcriptional regulator [Chromatiales bacterium]
MEITIYTLGRFSILRNGDPLRFKSKKPRVPLNLLATLIAFGGREVPAERLCDALWPDSEGDRAGQALATTLFRLRELLGVEAIQRRGHQLTLNHATCWVDCWALERLFNSSTEDPFTVFSKISGLYQGPFLMSEGDNVSWLHVREHLHRKVLRYIATCAGALEREGRYDKVTQVLVRGLEIDRTNEDFVRGVMRAYAVLDRPGEGVIAYRHWHRSVVSLTGGEPSAKTQHLYQSLLAG